MKDPKLIKLEEAAQRIAHTIQRELANLGLPHPQVGFTLFVFEMGNAPGWTTYVSSAQRPDMIRAISEWMALQKKEQS